MDAGAYDVLIESDWNLKTISIVSGMYWLPVLIESDWNLKLSQLIPTSIAYTVLIESDWNLKFTPPHLVKDSFWY